MSTKKTKSEVLSASKEETYRAMITQTGILERGWTKSMITKFLPEPAHMSNNPYNKIYPVKLWFLETVEEAEKTEPFQTALEKAKVRQAAGQAAAKKGYATKVENLRKRLQSEANRMEVEILDDDELWKQVYEDRLERSQDRYYDEPDLYSVPRETQERWIVNYIRHHLTNYDLVLSWCQNDVGMHVCYCGFKDAILRKIAEAYPKYADACRNQMYEPFESRVDEELPSAETGIA